MRYWDKTRNVPDRPLTKLDQKVFIFTADHGQMLHAPNDRPITELYDQVRPQLPTARIATPAGIGLAVGVIAMVICMAAGVVATLSPKATFEIFRQAALVAFCLGLIALIASGVFSMVGMAKGLRDRVHILRFDEEHSQLTALAQNLASQRADVGELLYSVQFQLRMIARIHDRLPVFTGLMTGVATATSLALTKDGGSFTEDLAWIAAGTGLGVAIARALAHQVQDRLMRVEQVLQIAVRLSTPATTKS